MESEFPEPRPPILGYRSPENDARSSWSAFGKMAAFIAGAGLSAGGTAFAGLIIGMNYFERNVPVSVKYGILLTSVGLVAGAIVGLSFAFRSPVKRWFVIGLLLGIGVTSLAEGICFSGA